MIPAWLIKDAKKLGGAGIAVALLWQAQGQVLQRLDKLTESVNKAVTMLSVHGEKFQHLDKSIDSLKKDVEYLKANAVFKQDIRYLEGDK